MDPFDAMHACGDEAGWSEETRLIMALRFVQKLAPMFWREFEAFLRDQLAQEMAAPR